MRAPKLFLYIPLLIYSIGVALSALGFYQFADTNSKTTDAEILFGGIVGIICSIGLSTLAIIHALIATNHKS